MAGSVHILRAIAHDPARESDRNPAGAVTCGTSVRLALRVDRQVSDQIEGCWLLVEDAEAAGCAESGEDIDVQLGELVDRSTRIPMEPSVEGYAVRLDTSGTPRVVFYRFLLLTGSGYILYAARADGRATSGSAFLLTGSGFDHADENGAANSTSVGFQLTIYSPDFEVPEWFSGSVMYQVFPDRFARGRAGVLWDGVESHSRRGWPVTVHQDWNDSPDWEEPYLPTDFFGGTLDGITEKLGYIASFGVEVLYLNPVWEARSNHRYDTGEYGCIDPILGDWDSMHRLVEEAGKLGMRIVLDTVLSHTGSSSKYFNADDSYDSLGAYQSEDSPYRSWYDFRQTGDGPGYRCWWNDPTLPEVNETDASWQGYILGCNSENGEENGEGPGSRHAFQNDPECSPGQIPCWISRGIAGLRLDVADEIPDDVLEKVRESAKFADPDTVIIGEVWEDPTTKESYGARRTYALGRALDSVMNYPLRDALLDFALLRSDARQLATFLKEQMMNYPAPLYMSLMNLLSSHDVERIRTVLDLGAEIRTLPRPLQVQKAAGITEEADSHGAALQQMLALAMYSLPGVPCLYYGDERGLQGGRDPFDRATFPWDGQRADCGLDVTDFYRALGRARSSSEALRMGKAAFYAHGKDVVCILRMAGSEAYISVVNRGRDDDSFAIDLLDPDSGISHRMAQAIRFAPFEPECVLASIATSTGDGVSAVFSATLDDGIFVCRLRAMESAIFRVKLDDETENASSAQILSSTEVQVEPSCKTHPASLARSMPGGLGVICHITSLPPESESGSGTLGMHAEKFADLLADTGFRYWQMLPITPADEHGSPYAGISAYAGNLHLLPESTRQAICASRSDSPRVVELDEYVSRWERHLLPYATFMAIKKLFNGAPWWEWPTPYRSWSEDLPKREELAEGVKAELRAQFAFDKKWAAFKEHANSRGVQIIGDMPIYVSADSADVWAHRQFFMVDESGMILQQGGAPPDQFAQEGQLWGNPTYRWDVLAENGYSWWMDRFERMMHWFDYVRIDHFIGFVNYYGVPAGKGAGDGQWFAGPGADIFNKAYENFGPLPFIAEDLGIVTDDVRELLAYCGFLGMDVIQFDDGDALEHWSFKPAKIRYTSTHDTSTLVGWIAQSAGEDAEAAQATAADVVHREIAAIRMALAAGTDGESGKSSNAGAEQVIDSNEGPILMLSLQDLLLLDDDARMNVPGTVGGNWEWQATEEQLEQLGQQRGRSTIS